MDDLKPQSGSCARCRRSLGLASFKWDGRWYGNEACVGSGPCPLDGRASAVPEASLYTRPQRFFRNRKPKELRRLPGDPAASYHESRASK